jgi:hypothetical protein
MKDLTVVRYPHRGSAKAVKSALNLHFHSRARASCVFALSIVIWLIPRVGIASEASIKSSTVSSCHANGSRSCPR